MKAIMVGATALTLASCATLDSGDIQRVAISTVPTGATCEISRDGVVIAREIEPPEIVTLDPGPPQIVVACVREGYAETRVFALIDREPALVGNTPIGFDVGDDGDEASEPGISIPPSIVYVELVREIRPIETVFDGQPSTPF